LSVLLYFLYSF